ncbi:ABC transporter permease [uncultured Serinicoccus sp.]|uniref:ABC transporter permease n=1 Tax=uncultured Serinicoccus sp. TaxID=735514 RepID=UPI0026339033|nr:ABC transporter permease [uncultured Serinicoccus sp.]
MTPDTTERRSGVSPWRVMGQRPTLSSYLRQLWRRRHFITAEARAKAFSGNRDMLLGNLWLIGVPILQGLAYYLIFGLILRTSRGIENFTGFLLVGIFLFRFTMASLQQGIVVMSQNRGMTSAFSFPRAAVPLSVLLRETLSMLPVLATLVLLLLTVPPGTQVTWTWALFPLVFGLQVLFNTGIIMYTARLGSALPDLRHVVAFVGRMWFYMSGVFFSLDRFVSEGVWLSVLQANPLYMVLDMSRDLLLYDTVPDTSSWLFLSLWAVITPLLGFWYFWQGEETYGQH